jgi:LytS/YehU family sensor histidine kinase
MKAPLLTIVLGVLISFLIAFAFVVFVLYSQRRESLLRQNEMELKQQLIEVELKALRAQINPHFIFNCMNSIYQYLQRNDSQTAGAYLVKFSNLIRLILENSIQTLVPLCDDLKTLDLYIQMEQLRMNHKFIYTIDVENNIDTEITLVPPMIIQPFVENSIWHGLNNKTSQGNLTINIKCNGEFLIYIVEDNGVQNQSSNIAAELNVNKKASMGMSLTQERIDILNKSQKAGAGFHMMDLFDNQNNYSGKRVELQIAFETEA